MNEEPTLIEMGIEAAIATGDRSILLATMNALAGMAEAAARTATEVAVQAEELLLVEDLG